MVVDFFSLIVVVFILNLANDRISFQKASTVEITVMSDVKEVAISMRPCSAVFSLREVMVTR